MARPGASDADNLIDAMAQLIGLAINDADRPGMREGPRAGVSIPVFLSDP